MVRRLIEKLQKKQAKLRLDGETWSGGRKDLEAIVSNDPLRQSYTHFYFLVEKMGLVEIDRSNRQAGFRYTIVV
jgi:hypothetical protein